MVMKQAVTSAVAVSNVPDANEIVVGQVNNVSPQPGGMPIGITATATILLGAGTTSCRLRVRRNTLTGTVVADSGAVAATASTRVARAVNDDDYLQDVAAMTYVLTVECAAAAAAATVEALSLQLTYQ